MFVGVPLLLVDIDGVLSPYGAESCPEGYEEYHLFPNDPDPHRLCPAHGRWLTELTEYFEVVWASAWGVVAHEILGPILGVREFPFVPMPDIPFLPAEKVAAVVAYAGSRAVVWLDDAFGPEAFNWAARRAEATLLVPIDPAIGMLRSHIDEALAWRRALHGH